MAVKSREEILSQINARIGEDNSDEALALIEDVTDTLTDLETRASGDGKDWKAEAERIDKEWREKYRARFSSGSSEEDNTLGSNGGTEKQYTFDKLFNEKEN